MTGFFDALIVQAQAWTALEAVAVVLAVLYLLLAIRQNIWCWLCAGISTAIYVYLFLNARLYMESALNVFYFAMAVYGWAIWHQGRSEQHQSLLRRGLLRRGLEDRERRDDVDAGV